MENKYILWQFPFSKPNVELPLSSEFRLEIFSPNKFNLRKYRFGSLPMYVFWRIFTEYKIVYITHNNELAHVNHVLRGYWKFPFMEEKDYVIGPAYTFPKYRRMGLYKASMSAIIKFVRINSIDSKIYIFAHIDNVPSNKAIEKMGFLKVGFLKKDRFGKYMII